MVQKNTSLRDVIATIVEGKVVQHSVTIPEGLTSEQIVLRLTDSDLFTTYANTRAKARCCRRPTFHAARTRPGDSAHAAGAEARAGGNLGSAQSRRAPEVTGATGDAGLDGVEKETGKADQRSRVAAVFVNHLRQKIKMQSDPTIIYGLVGGKGTLGRPIKRSEITQPSPYNTYVIEGLPPGPIANPGRASLEASADPARARDLLADGTGGHAFTETYDQHQKNVAKLRTMEKQIQNDTVEPSAPAGRSRCAGRRHQPDGYHAKAGGAEEAGAPGPAGRGAIRYHAASDAAVTSNRNVIPLSGKSF